MIHACKCFDRNNAGMRVRIPPFCACINNGYSTRIAEFWFTKNLALFLLLTVKAEWLLSFALPESNLTLRRTHFAFEEQKLCTP